MKLKSDKKIRIKETSEEDLEHILKLWNDDEVMFFVGFPNGLGITMEKLHEWLLWVISKPQRCHYSIYQHEIGFCGETFYNVDKEHGVAALDIKLIPEARGRGIAEFALSYVIKQAFTKGHAKKVYVDPHPNNKKAWMLYEKLGFSERPRPDHLEDWASYLEITREEWGQ